MSALFKIYEDVVRKQQGIPPEMSLKEASDRANYDYTGFINAMVAGDPRASAAINPSDNMLHFPDPWKYETHPTIQWKSREDYQTQGNYPGMSFEAMINGLRAPSSSDPVYKEALKLEENTPMLRPSSIDDRVTQNWFTRWIFDEAKRRAGEQ